MIKAVGVYVYICLRMSCMCTYTDIHTCNVSLWECICIYVLCVYVCMWACPAMQRTFVITGILNPTMEQLQKALGCIYPTGNVKSQALWENDRIQNSIKRYLWIWITSIPVDSGWLRETVERYFSTSLGARRTWCKEIAVKERGRMETLEAGTSDMN